MYLNPAFFSQLSSPQQDGLLLHEVLHAALLHVARRRARDPLLWNIADDIVVNGMILKEEGFALPAGALRHRGWEECTVEEVYELLLRDATVHHHLALRDLLDSPPADGGHATLPGATLEAHWQNARHQARLVAQAAGRGFIPAGLARELHALQPAQLDWRAYLWRYLVRTPTDFADFDRRFVGRGLYLETLAGETVHVHVAVDTSGSVPDHELALFLGEVAGIVQAYPHLQCDLYYVDSAVHGPYPLTPDLSMPAPIGAGGTDFRPFFTRIADDHDPWTGGVLVYLTDGYGAFPDTPPALPVLWVVTPGGRDLATFPFGEATRLLASA